MARIYVTEDGSLIDLTALDTEQLALVERIFEAYRRHPGDWRGWKEADHPRGTRNPHSAWVVRCWAPLRKSIYDYLKPRRNEAARPERDDPVARIQFDVRFRMSAAGEGLSGPLPELPIEERSGAE